MKEVILPEGFDPSTPLSYFTSRPDQFVMTYTLEKMHIAHTVRKLTPEISQFMSLVKSNATKIFKIIENNFDDYHIIEAMLDLVEFIDEHSEDIKVHFKIAADLIACLMMCIYKLSDRVKNRNMDIIPDTGWQIFDLLGKLVYQNIKNNLMSSRSYMSLQFVMQPKIIDEITLGMRSVLQQIHDTEEKINNISNRKMRFSAFDKDYELCKQVAELQQGVEESIAAADLSQAEKQSGELRKIIKANNLKPSFDDLHYFCTTVNNLCSLNKLREIVKTAQSFGKLTTPSERAGFLQCLVQIGEYMSHRKLSNKFRENYPGVSWESYQMIRDCLSHPEDGNNKEIAEKLLRTGVECEGQVSLSMLQYELRKLDCAIASIIKRRFSDSNAQFFNEYLDRYRVESVWICSEEDQLFFLGNLKGGDVLVKRWREILSGECLLPKQKIEFGRLKKIVFKTKDNEKKKRINEIIKRLIDVRDTGGKVLYPRQIKCFKKTSLYKESKARWSKLLNDQIICPTIDEYYAVCELIDTDLLELLDQGNPVCTDAYFCLKINDIYEKIRLKFEKCLRRQWAGIMQPKQLNRFFKILHKNPEIEKRWLKVLHQENPFPSLRECKADLYFVKKQSQEVAIEFINLVKLLKHIELDAPNIDRLKDKFIAGYKKKGNESILKTVFDKKRICSIAINEIDTISSIIDKLLYGEQFVKSVARDVVIPMMNEDIKKKASTNPSYQKFLEKRQAIYDKVADESRRTGKEVALPLEHIKKLYDQMVIEDPGKAESKLQLYGEFSESLKEAYRGQHEHELPNQINYNPEFRLALEFHLTRSLSLLKRIIKFSNQEDAGFLFDNYMLLKKCRNDLVHGDYIKESLGRDLKEITRLLVKHVPHIMCDLKSIFETLEKVKCDERGHSSEETENSTSYSSSSPRLYKQSKDQPMKVDDKGKEEEDEEEEKTSFQNDP